MTGRCPPGTYVWTFPDRCVCRFSRPNLCVGMAVSVRAAIYRPTFLYVGDARPSIIILDGSIDSIKIRVIWLWYSLCVNIIAPVTSDEYDHVPSRLNSGHPAGDVTLSCPYRRTVVSLDTDGVPAVQTGVDARWVELPRFLEMVQFNSALYMCYTMRLI